MSRQQPKLPDTRYAWLSARSHGIVRSELRARRGRESPVAPVISLRGTRATGGSQLLVQPSRSSDQQDDGQLAVSRTQRQLKGPRAIKDTKLRPVGSKAAPRDPLVNPPATLVRSRPDRLSPRQTPPGPRPGQEPAGPDSPVRAQDQRPMQSAAPAAALCIVASVIVPPHHPAQRQRR